MQQISEEDLLPADIDAQPPVRAAAALRSVIRGYHDEIEREQRLPKALVEQFHAAGFYRLVIPRELGGLQADPLTYVRVVELLAEGAGSVGWNVANNSIGQLITLGLPDEGVHEIYMHGADTVIAGTAVMGGGRAVPVEGGYRVTGRWPFGTGCQESSWMLGSFQIFDGVEPRRSPDGSSVFWRGVFARSEAQIVEGSWDVSGMRATGSFDWTVDDVFLPERRTRSPASASTGCPAGRRRGPSFAAPAGRRRRPSSRSCPSRASRSRPSCPRRSALPSARRARASRPRRHPGCGAAARRRKSGSCRASRSSPGSRCQRASDR